MKPVFDNFFYVKLPLLILPLALGMLTACQTSSGDHAMDLETNFAKAREMIVKGNHVKARRLLLDCADKGHGGCAQTLGSAYYAGRLVNLDIDKAVGWHRKAYETGTAHGFSGIYSAISLSVIMCDGRYSKGNYSEYMHWIGRAKLLLDQLVSAKHRMPSKTEIAFNAVTGKITELEARVTPENCPSSRYR